jgi:NADH:ubiquinone oxidoreductase subunit E
MFFIENNIEEINKILKKYKHKESALVPILMLAQSNCDGWLPEEILNEIENFLNISKLRIMEVVTFYHMFNLRPVKKYQIKVCRTLPCWINGADKIYKMIKDCKDIDIDLKDIECIGRCISAPVIQINDKVIENIDESFLKETLEHIKTSSKKL